MMSRLDEKRSEGFGYRGSSASGGPSFYGEHRDHGRGHYQGGRGRGGHRSRGRGGSFGSAGSGGSKFAKSYSEEVREQMDDLYKRKFKYQDHSDQWRLPDSSVMFQTVGRSPSAPELQELKSRLNAAKDQLESKEMVSWGRHTNFTNRAGIIISALRRDFEPELCTLNWTKLHEIMWTFDVVPKSAVKYNSVHLCEAPGAFVASLNHFLKTHRTDCNWKWKATTLNPYHEGNSLTPFSDQDYFMSETKSHWFIGPDNTGDITHWENVVALKGAVKKDLEEVNLVTADGALSSFSDPNRQEQQLSRLLFCETVAALILLARDGALILKTFTTFEPYTISLLYLLSCCFNEVNVFKPVTSKSSNSEQYVICTKYKGRGSVSKMHWEQLIHHYGEDVSMTTIFPMATIPQCFQSQVMACAKKFANYQVMAIDENVDLYDCMTCSKRQFIVEVKELTCDTFKTRFKLKKLSRDKAIVPTIHLNGTHLTVAQPVRDDPVREWLERRSVETFLSHLDQRKSNSERTAFTGDGIPEAKLPKISLDQDVCSAVKHVLTAVGFEGSRAADKTGTVVAIEMEPEDVQWLRGSTSQSYDVCKDIGSLEGAKVNKVINSRFCHHDVIKRLSDALAQSQITDSSRVDEHTNIASHMTPGHALLNRELSFFLNKDALDFAALDFLTGFIRKPSDTLLFMDLAGAPSGFSHYIYWRRQNTTKGWGLVRSENPILGPGQVVERLAPWETFQVLGPHNGVNICDSNTIRSLCAGVENYCPDGVHLVIGNVPDIPFGAHPPGQADILISQHLLSQLICSCKILSKGGTFVCRCYELLTRFSAGLLYLMYKLFREVTVLKPMTSSSTSSERFILCRGYHGNKTEVTDSLLEVNGNITELKGRGKEGGVAILEIVPMHLLLEETFHRYLTQSNERVAKQRTRIITAMEEVFQKPENLPNMESQELLCKGTLEILDLPETPVLTN